MLEGVIIYTNGIDNNIDNYWDKRDEGFLVLDKNRNGEFSHFPLPKISATILDSPEKHCLDIGSFDIWEKCSDKNMVLILDISLVTFLQDLGVGVCNSRLHRRWELLGNYCDFIVVMVFYLFFWRTKRILVTAITGFKFYILIQSLMLFI